MGALRERLRRLDDHVVGTPGTRHGAVGDLVLGVHHWLAPVYLLFAVVGIYGVVITARDGDIGGVIFCAGFAIAALALARFVWSRRSRR